MLLLLLRILGRSAHSLAHAHTQISTINKENQPAVFWTPVPMCFERVMANKNTFDAGDLQMRKRFIVIF